MQYIRNFDTIGMSDVAIVGGKNASLGEMISRLASQGIEVPSGFAVTAQAYWHYLDTNTIREQVIALASRVTRCDDMAQISHAGEKIRALIMQGNIPDDLAQEICMAYHALSKRYHIKNCSVAVRSSATAEDLPTASFAGQQETYLNVAGDHYVLHAYKKSLASLFTDRAISYRCVNSFDTEKVGLSVGIQKMVRSDKGCAGVAFSLDTESGFSNAIVINSAYGLGEGIVKGWVNPDEFVVFKPTIDRGEYSIIQKRCGTKKTKIVYAKTTEDQTKQVAVSKKNQHGYSLSDEQIVQLARMVLTIEQYYSELNQKWTPMDVEWAYDGVEKKMYIVQARPETVHAVHGPQLTLYRLESKPTAEHVIVTGQSIGQRIVTGVARVVSNVRDAQRVQPGDILVTSMTDPDWGPILKRVGGIITDLGGRTCHAAIVSREMGTPAIVGTEIATKKIRDGQKITLDASQGETGFVYEGEVPFTMEKIAFEKLPQSPVPLMLNMADPDRAFLLGQLPVKGVGLARMEFIISNYIRIHPMALIDQHTIQDKRIARTIAQITYGYKNGADFFVETMARCIARIAAGFFPRPVIVRLSDFKTNEYRNLIGGSYFEPHEENPMLGFRGAARYVSPEYRAAFDLECRALCMVRDQMGFENVHIMVPFVRTAEQARGVVDILEQHGLKCGQHNLKIVMMCEVPSNVVNIDAFAEYFDSFSIGSNDLTQLTLGVDRDSAILASVFNEQDPAVKAMVRMAIEGAHRNKHKIGICGQGPSDYPDFADFLIEQDIDYISLNPDSLLSFLERHRK